MKTSIHGETGPRVVAGKRVNVLREKAPIGRPGQCGALEPEIILIREGDAVRAIEVVCTCGERIRLNCVF